MWLKQTGSAAVETEQESHIHLTSGLLQPPQGPMPACQQLWHHQPQSHPSGTHCQSQNFLLRLLVEFRRCQKDEKECVKELTWLINCESGVKEKAETQRHTVQRARHPAPINFTLWYTLPAKRAPLSFSLSAKWKDVQMGRLHCLHKLSWIIFTFLCSGLICKAFTCSLQVYKSHTAHNLLHMLPQP